VVIGESETHTDSQILLEVVMHGQRAVSLFCSEMHFFY
jgi:hypothetical protein